MVVDVPMTWHCHIRALYIEHKVRVDADSVERLQHGTDRATEIVMETESHILVYMHNPPVAN